MNAEEQEYMDYLIHNRTQLTNQITRHLDELLLLQKKLDIATKALKKYANEKNWRTATTIINTDYFEYENSMYSLNGDGFEEAQKAIKEMEEVK